MTKQTQTKIIVSKARIEEITRTIKQNSIEQQKLYSELCYAQDNINSIKKQLIKTEKISDLRYYDSLAVSLGLTLVALMHVVALYIELYGTKVPANYILFGILGCSALVVMSYSLYLTQKMIKINKE